MQACASPVHAAKTQGRARGGAGGLLGWNRVHGGRARPGVAGRWRSVGWHECRRAQQCWNGAPDGRQCPQSSSQGGRPRKRGDGRARGGEACVPPRVRVCEAGTGGGQCGSGLTKAASLGSKVDRGGRPVHRIGLLAGAPSCPGRDAGHGAESGSEWGREGFWQGPRDQPRRRVLQRNGIKPLLRRRPGRAALGAPPPAAALG